MNFSILIPTRNGVEYLVWAYNSIRKNQGNHYVEIIVLDDISDKDNTWEWCTETAKKDFSFLPFKNTTSERHGISGGYNFLAKEATQDIICHWHNDMFMTEGTLDRVAEQLQDDNKVVCLTRIEPPIYGKGPEKIVWEKGPIDVEDWNEEKFKAFLGEAQRQWGGKTTGGHFAPFFMHRKKYQELGGNDLKCFPKQSRDDSCLAFRMVLAGFETVQIPHFTYHFASRGNRRSKHETTAFKDNPAWEKINMRSTKNFIRKWGTLVMHDEYLKPIPPKKYNIGFVVKNCTRDLLHQLEPWCDQMETDLSREIIKEYIEKEQPNTPFKLEKKLGKGDTSIVVDIDGDFLSDSDFKNIELLSKIIENSNEVGEFVLGNLKIFVKSLESYEKSLIKVDNSI